MVKQTRPQLYHLTSICVPETDRNSDFSSEDGSSDVSDLDKFEEAYKKFSGLTASVDILSS